MIQKITPDIVRAIRKEYKIEPRGQFKVSSATNVIELGKRYGLSQQTIRDIAKRNLYEWVSDG